MKIVKQIKILSFVVLLLTVKAGSSYAGNPLDVFTGGRVTPYPVAPEPSGQETSKVKIKDKGVYLEHGDQVNTVADEGIPSVQEGKGIISEGKDIPVMIPDDIDIVGDEEGPVAEVKDEPDFIGTWRQTALYVDGVPNPHSSALMTLKKDSFISSSSCTAQGTLSYGENTLTLVMTSTSCRGVPLPLAVTYHYEISEDNSTLSWSTASQSEVFVREK